MNNNLLQTNLIIGGETFVIKSIEVQSFFDLMRDHFYCNNIHDLVSEFENLKEDIITHYPDEKIAKTLKKRLLLVQELQYFLKGFLVPVKASD